MPCIAATGVHAVAAMAPIRLFTLAGISVQTSIGFLLLLAYFGFMHRAAGPVGIVLVLLAVTLTLLIHEFGHALVARRYRLDPQILLHGWGGLCFHTPASRPSHEAMITVAGSAAQLAVAGVVYLAVALAGPIAIRELAFFLDVFVTYSVFWALLNLIPIFPLDGGQLLRLALARFVRPAARAERLVHQIGMALSVAIVIVGYVVLNSTMLALFGIMWAMENFRYLQEGSPTRAVERRSVAADGMLREAVAAFQAGDFREARRLAFQTRSERGLEQDQLDQAVRIIAVASAELEDWDEALDWSRRAPRTPDVFAARMLALIHKGHVREAEQEMAAPDAVELPPLLLQRIRGALASQRR
jgi:Zn-dependent protease